MPLINHDDQELLDPLSEVVAGKLESTGFRICRFKLKEFVYSRAKEMVLRLSPQLGDPENRSKKTLDRLVDFQAKLDYTHDLSSLVRDFVALYGDEKNPKPIAPDRAARLAALEKHYHGVFGKETPEEQKDKEIDKPIIVGGLTALHVASQSGNLTEVKRLVEECDAKVNVRDNAKMTPKMRAEAMGHAHVAAYLANFS